MSSTAEKSLQEVEQLIIHGKFKEALKVIATVAKTEGLIKEDQLALKVLKSEIQHFLGKHKEAFALAEEVLEESKDLGNTLLHVDALIQKIMTNFFLTGELNETLNYAEKGFELINSISSDIPAIVLAKRKTLLLIMKGTVMISFADYAKSLEFFQESLSFAEESGNKQIITRCLSYLGMSYNLNNEPKKAAECNVKAQTIAKEIGNKVELAFSYIFEAIITGNRREYEKAIELMEKAYSLSKEVGSTLVPDMSINNMGLFYRALFQLDKALECFQSALKRSSAMPQLHLNNIGYTYLMKFELEKAQEYYLKSLKISEEKKDRRILISVLYNLVIISIELKNLVQAQQYLERLEQISNETGFDRIDRLYRYASIMLLKASSDFSDWGQSAELLKVFLKEEDLPSDWRLDALYSLLEISLKELQLSTTEEALKEVQKRLHHLEVEAEEQQLRWLLGNVYRLQSQLAIVELDAKKAIELLEKAQVIAEEINVELLKKEIKEDQEKIEQQLNMLQKFQEQKAPLSEIVKLVSLENTVKSVKQETVLEERDKETGKIIEYRKLFSLKL
ncbi:MAG: tetratricopeptide repeat protein [Candidatus Heimdallarchaeota archaeon]